jgi:patatin-related protein
VSTGVAGDAKVSLVREKELRLALVCYGGISLAVYMHGLTREIWKLVRASRGFYDEQGKALDGSDSEPFYAELLAEMAKHVRLRVLVDIIAGASAGGINGIFLAQAISTGQSLDPLADLWLEKADADELLDPAAVPRSRFSKLYAWPLLWAARLGRVDPMDEIVEREARDEVRRKVSRFVRSRWFEPPFSGPHFTELLLGALDQMAATKAGPALLPDGQPLDLFVTVTDYHGYPERLRLHSPTEIMEREHRKIIALRDDGERGETRRLCDVEGLAFAARATASFPGAFPPFQPRELDAVLARQKRQWPRRAEFLARVFPRRARAGIDMTDAPLIDGSVLNNAPFAPAIAALRQRPAHREIDRRFVYLDPKPGIRSFGGKFDPAKPPGFFSTILRSLSDIPREQPIRDDLERLQGLSARVRRLSHVVDGIRQTVDIAIEEEIGSRQLRARASPERMKEWRARTNAAAVAEAGYTYPGYAHLKLSQIVEDMARLFVVLGNHGDADQAEQVRKQTWRHIRRSGIDRVALTTKPRTADKDSFVQFVRSYDLGFRIRRLRFLIRRINEWADAADPAHRPEVESLKASLYELLAPFLDRRSHAFFGPWVRDPASLAHEDPGAVIAAYGDALGLTAFDALVDTRLTSLIESGLSDELRSALITAYLGFPFFDIATFPLLQGEGLDEFDEIKVDRISPDDATSIRKGGAAATLKGVKFNSFGAFFSRAYRENDYLWGRLHGLDRLIDIVASSMPEGAQFPDGFLADLKTRAFRAILASEAPRLTSVPQLVDELRHEVG